MPKLTRARRIDLGLALLATRGERGRRRTIREIAAWCGCSPSYTYKLERRALRKLKGRLDRAGCRPDPAAAG